MLNAGNYAAVVVQGTLRLKGGSYQLASLQLANDAKVEALAPAQLHIAGRLSLLDRDRIGAAAGVSLAAGDVQIEVAGRNGASGSLTDSPKAVSLGNSDVLSALILAPNGTLQVGQRATLVGAFAARDVFIDVDSQVHVSIRFCRAHLLAQQLRRLQPLHDRHVQLGDLSARAAGSVGHQ